MSIETFDVGDLSRRVERLQVRAMISPAVVADYAAEMLAGAEFPPVVVFRDAHGVERLADGAHRLAASMRAERAEIQADVREGGLYDAIRHAVTANTAHGMRRTNSDKRMCVALALELPNADAMSDRDIAHLCGVTADLVGIVRCPEPKVKARPKEEIRLSTVDIRKNSETQAQEAPIASAPEAPRPFRRPAIFQDHRSAASEEDQG